MIQLLSWDSACFGYKIGELIAQSNDILSSLKQAKEEGYSLVYARVNPSDEEKNQILISNKANLVDERITFTKVISQVYPTENQQVEIYKNDFITDELLELTLESGLYSRFKLDEKFQNQEFEKLYTAWITNSVKKEIAKQVFIQQNQHKIIGLLTLANKNNYSEIGILAVNPEFRRLSLGRNLVLSAIRESKLWGFEKIQVNTQKANQGACRFYQKMGFEILTIENVYHYWI
jgi:dTDP-4-amino-4,6-dideoxy-D-galactose acyltransferase